MTSQQRLTRSRNDKVVAGVCGGLGKYFGLDPVLVRLVMVALVFAGGISILIYPILWLAMPVESGSAQLPAEPAAGSTLTGYTMPSDDANRPLDPSAASARRNNLLGALLLGTGVLMLASFFSSSPLVLALLVLAGGVYLLRK